jgi:peroxiredoxin Q/BCP
MLKINDQVPDFTLPDENGTVHTLAEYAKKWLLIYFYPKDDTPGCTTEACTIRDNFPNFKKLPITILGVSADSPKSHKKFIEKYQLPFTLLADEEKKLATAFGVWGKKKFMGKEYMGISRSSFLINPEGVIVKVYENVKPAVHAEEILADLKLLL